jgi:hypothetical protein
MVRWAFATMAMTTVSFGCSISHPIFLHDHSGDVGKTLSVENTAVLLASGSWLPAYEIQAGKIDAASHHVAELPVGTDITIKSFWRNRRLLLIGGFIQQDYAIVKVSSPSTNTVTARLAVEEFDDVFDGSLYHPQLPD